MHQALLNIRTGRLSVDRVPDPVAQAGHVLIANRASLISAGTEKMARELAQKSLFAKARLRPDHARRVWDKVLREGIWKTARQVLDKLDEPMSMGYCSAGIVLACGPGVENIKPGDAVASNGPHANTVCVPKHLCARIPDGVPFDQAAFTVLGAVALQGVRLSRAALGETALVIGLGLLGQITVALLKAAGVRVLGTDPDAAKCDLALAMGADIARPNLRANDVADVTAGLGADVVIITASTPSDAPVQLAGDAVRQKGRVVAVGAVGMNLPRRPYYFKEAEFVVSCSYGPGRYDAAYEESGQDYPAAYVRWTEQRNMQAFLELMAAGKVDISRLISHRYAIADACTAYNLIESNAEPYLGIVLEYPLAQPQQQSRRMELRHEAHAGRVAFGCLGAGNFARSTLLPAIRKIPAFSPHVLCSAGGLSAAHAGRKFGFAAVTTDENDVIDDPNVQAVFIATRHDQHARQVIRSLGAGKHVFVEKPLALTREDIEKIEHALTESKRLLMVGFNRRFSPAAQAARKSLAGCQHPLTISIRFNAGQVPPDHWIQNPLVGGGRIVGEACHAIDLATFLAGSPPSRVFAESIGGPDAPTITDDQAFITLRHANGSVSNIAYLAGGNSALPKERVEVFGGGRIAVIDDFRRTSASSGGKLRSVWHGGQDKGHLAELQAFAKAIESGGTPPIAWQDMRAVSLATLLAVGSLRQGEPLDVL